MDMPIQPMPQPQPQLPKPAAIANPVLQTQVDQLKVVRDALKNQIKEEKLKQQIEELLQELEQLRMEKQNLEAQNRASKVVDIQNMSADEMVDNQL